MEQVSSDSGRIQSLFSNKQYNVVLLHHNAHVRAAMGVCGVDGETDFFQKF
jgi:hypothetical protein